MSLLEIAAFSFFLLFISWGSKRLSFIPLLCLLFGIGWGFFNPAPSTKTFEVVAKITLIFFLFVDGARLHIPKIIHYNLYRLPTIGFAVALVLGTFCIKLLFPFTLKEALFVVLPLLAIDAKTISFKRLIPTRIEQMVNVESSFTGILAIFILSLFISPLTFFFPLLIGLAIGYLAGLIAKKNWGEFPLLRGSLILIPFATYALCTFFHFNGFIGVIGAALIFGHTARPLCATLFDFSHRYGTLLFYLLLIFFGIFALPILSNNLAPLPILFALLFLIIIRFIAVIITFLGAKYQWKTHLYVTFMNPKGVIPIAILFLGSEIFSFPAENIILTTTFLSLLIHPLFVYPVTHSYGSAIRCYHWSEECVPVVRFPL